MFPLGLYWVFCTGQCSPAGSSFRPCLLSLIPRSSSPRLPPVLISASGAPSPLHPALTQGSQPKQTALRSDGGHLQGRIIQFWTAKAREAFAPSHWHSLLLWLTWRTQKCPTPSFTHASCSPAWPMNWMGFAFIVIQNLWLESRNLAPLLAT